MTVNYHNHDWSYNQRQHYLRMLFGQQQTSWRTSCSEKQGQLRPRTSSPHLEGDAGEGGEEHIRKESEDILTDSSSITIIIATGHIVPSTRRHRPNTSIIVTSCFSVLYLISLLFTSEFDILLPSYLKSASESVHQLYRTPSQKLTAISSTSSSLHILPSSFASTSCRWQQRRHRWSGQSYITTSIITAITSIATSDGTS